MSKREATLRQRLELAWCMFRVLCRQHRRLREDHNLERVSWLRKWTLARHYVRIYRAAMFRELEGGRWDGDVVEREADAEATRAIYKMAGF